MCAPRRALFAAKRRKQRKQRKRRHGPAGCAAPEQADYAARRRQVMSNRQDLMVHGAAYGSGIYLARRRGGGGGARGRVVKALLCGGG